MFPARGFTCLSAPMGMDDHVNGGKTSWENTLPNKGLWGIE